MGEEMAGEEYRDGMDPLLQDDIKARMESLPSRGDEDASAIFRSCVLHKELLQRAQKLPRGMTRTQMNIIISLNTLGELAMTPLSESLGVSNEQASRAIKPLIEHGMVERERSPKNKRVVTVRLTESGQTFLEELLRQELETLVSLLSPLTEEEFGRLAECSRECEQLIYRAIERRCDPFSIREQE